jgi:hypothetical protein
MIMFVRLNSVSPCYGTLINGYVYIFWHMLRLRAQWSYVSSTPLPTRVLYYFIDFVGREKIMGVRYSTLAVDESNEYCQFDTSAFF